MSALDERLEMTLADLQQAGTYKALRHLSAPMGPTTTIEEVGEVLVFCSNNYLGLANHPEVVQAVIEGLQKYGAGTASVRFICGTFDCHRQIAAPIPLVGGKAQEQDSFQGRAVTRIAVEHFLIAFGKVRELPEVLDEFTNRVV